MRKIIIIVLVLLVVAGGGAGGMVMLGVVRNPFKPPPAHVPDAVELAAAEADAKAKANAFHAPIAALQLVKAGDILVPILSPDGHQQQVFVTARLVAATGAKNTVTDELPKFVDAVLSDLIPYFGQYYASHDMVDITVLKKKLVRHAHEVFGDDVTDVLLVNVFESGTGANAQSFPVGSD